MDKALHNMSMAKDYLGWAVQQRKIGFDNNAAYGLGKAQEHLALASDFMKE